MDYRDNDLEHNRYILEATKRLYESVKDDPIMAFSYKKRIDELTLIINEQENQ